jgi:hypothetical protein
LRGDFAAAAFAVALRAGAFLEAVRTADLAAVFLVTLAFGAAFGAFARDFAGAFALAAVFGAAVFDFTVALAIVSLSL